MIILIFLFELFECRDWCAKLFFFPGFLLFYFGSGWSLKLTLSLWLNSLNTLDRPYRFDCTLASICCRANFWSSSYCFLPSSTCHICAWLLYYWAKESFLLRCVSVLILCAHWILIHSFRSKIRRWSFLLNCWNMNLCTSLTLFLCFLSH